MVRIPQTWRGYIAVAAAIAFVVLGHHAPAAGQAPSRVMALTFDDLPYATVAPTDPSYSPAAGRVTKAMLQALAVHHAPATAFVNEGKLAADRAARVAVLQQWVTAGATLGNHTSSHLDFNTATAQEFEDDILRGEVVTRALMQPREPYQRYFRHPETHTGDTVAKKVAVEEFLAGHGYTVAPHTIDSSDFIFNAVLLDAQARDDAATIARVRAAYLEFVIGATSFAEYAGHAIFGRDIPQTVLLHANDLNADTLDDLLIRLEQRGYHFVSLDAAMSDPAYRTKDTFVSRFGPTWLWRWRQSLGLSLSFRDDPEPPAWIMDRYNARER